MLSPAVTAPVDELAVQFQRHEPVRYVAIDNFFDAAICACLLAEFPPFERGYARNEAGQPSFETTELSWHGFGRIELPEDKPSISRKSIALYFYTNDRPVEELADTHTTIYVDRPLPEPFKPGLTLSDADVQERRLLLARRDQHNRQLCRDTTMLTAQLEQAQTALHGGKLGRLRYFVRRMLTRGQR